MDAFVRPEAIIEALGVKPGARVADLGAGVGHYSLPISKIVSDAGKVYAIEIQRELISTLQAEARKLGRNNIEVVWADLEQPGGSKLAAGMCDDVIASNVLFQIEDKNTFIGEIARMLKPGGRVAVIDWSESFDGMGPAAQQVFDEAAARAAFEKAGFTFVSTLPAGSHHYGIVFSKAH